MKATAHKLTTWEGLKAIGSIEQLKSSYVVVVLVPPMIQVVEMARKAIEQIDDATIDVDIGWRLPVAYFAAFALAVGKLIFDIMAPRSIRDYDSAQHLLLHGIQVHPSGPLAGEAATGRGLTLETYWDSTAKIIYRTVGAGHPDILGPSIQVVSDHVNKHKVKPFEVDSNLAYTQWATDLGKSRPSRIVTAFMFAVGGVLSVVLVAHSLWAVLVALL